MFFFVHKLSQQIIHFEYGKKEQWKSDPISKKQRSIKSDGLQLQAECDLFLMFHRLLHTR